LRDKLELTIVKCGACSL